MISDPADSRLIRSIPAFLLGLFVIGCASQWGLHPGTGPASSVIAEQGGGVDADSSTALLSVIEAPVDQIWSTMPLLFRILGLRAAPLGPLTFGNDSFQTTGRLAGELPSRHLDCGLATNGRPLADEGELDLALAVALSPEDSERTNLRVRLRGFARTDTGAPHTCETTWRLERGIADLLRELHEN